MDKKDIVIDRANPKDAEAIINIKRKAWVEAYPNPEFNITELDIKKLIGGANGELIEEGVSNWRRGIAAEDGDERVTFVARRDDVVIGYCQPVRDEGGRRCISQIYVDPSKQGSGVGQLLMEAALQWLGRDEDIYLEVLSWNRPAVKFYVLQGFVLTGNDYKNNEDLLGDGKYTLSSEMVLKAA